MPAFPRRQPDSVMIRSARSARTMRGSSSMDPSVYDIFFIFIAVIILKQVFYFGNGFIILIQSKSAVHYFACRKGKS